MANREIFSKHLPNVKLATRLDAEGREVQVERREDVDATLKQQETFDMLVAAGYYRAAIRGLSAFDKVVGGMTFLIECCDYDVDVDLLFHENLTIGQKIALVEKIVTVLPQMKCPFRIEPHQIQGLEFISIHPVIQWLVKKSAENRAERAQRLKKFAIGQFHNHYQYQSDKQQLAKIRNASMQIKRVQELFSPKRQYERQAPANEADERTRVLMTLLEYGHKVPQINKAGEVDVALTAKQQMAEEAEADNLLKTLFIAREPSSKQNVAVDSLRLNETERLALQKHYTDFKHEMETDAKQLSEQSQIKMLEEKFKALEAKVKRNQAKNSEIEQKLASQRELLTAEQAEQMKLENEIAAYKQIEAQADPSILNEVQTLLRQHDQLKKDETEFKEFCRKDLSELQAKIDELEAFNAKNPEEQAAAVAKEKALIQDLKLKIAKKNRGIVAIERKLDEIPDRTELTQYQRRFHELYNEMNAKHLETKQYYAFYNTLEDKKRYIEKELSLLNSICETYNEGIVSTHGREEFIAQFEKISAGVRQTEEKLRRKFNEERLRRDMLNGELQDLLELQRQYAIAVKELTQECQRCEQMQQQLKSIGEH